MTPAPFDLTPRHPRRTLALLVLATFLAVDLLGLTLFRAWAADLTGWPRMAALGVLGYGLYLAAPLAVAAYLFGPRRAFASLGLTASPAPAVALAAVCSAPVWIGYAICAPIVPVDSVALAVTRGALLPGAAEEILFRAFLFGFLYRFASWPFLPAALFASLVFGLEHLYQSDHLAEAAGIALLTGLGGVWWSWLLLRWRWNAWIPLAFHVSLNAAYETFDVADNALGPAWTVALRALCIALSIVITVRLTRGGAPG